MAEEGLENPRDIADFKVSDALERRQKECSNYIHAAG
jgi:hypothetical protein